MKKKILKELCALLLTVCALLAVTVIGSQILMPKRMDYGSTWGRFLAEHENSTDVLFFGSSITYCDIVPAVIYEHSKISAYDMAGPEQTIPITYYYVRETLKTQQPKAVFVEITGVFFNRYQDYTKVNVGYMPWGTNRLGATIYASEKEEWQGLFFPPYNYHSRWDSLEDVDFSVALFGYPADNLAGYTFLNTAAQMDGAAPRNETYDEDNYVNNIKYLEKIAALCKEEGITPVFFIAPTCWRLSDEHLLMLETDIRAIDGSVYRDFNADDGLSLYDLNTDFYDDLHFNCYGAEKFSRMLADFLTEELALKPSENADAALWSERVRTFHAMCTGA